MTNQSQSLEESPSKIDRLIDANLNRLKEGLRVIEDICRYIHDDKQLTSTIKNLRHQLQLSYKIERLKHRNIESDIQKASTKSELSRGNLQELIIANFSRAQESGRVLEEVLKLQSIEESERFKTIRYTLYGLEKEYFEKYL
ncbi:MAG: thiamine-phosphate pyrophosphorylase [Epsilonproteobacteria bacterium]|nr:thiamine-phosphate pyrophosphorylase [Campylobacterota bacterium]